MKITLTVVTGLLCLVAQGAHSHEYRVGDSGKLIKVGASGTLERLQLEGIRMVAGLPAAHVPQALGERLCLEHEVKDSALKVANALFRAAGTSEFDGIHIPGSPTWEMVGVHRVEKYQGLWVKKRERFEVQISLEFVYRPNGNRSYGKTGCGLIGVSIPFFQAP